MTVIRLPKVTKNSVEDKVLDFNELSGIRLKHPQSTIVHCHGVFDVLHAGHLAYFQSAKKFGDILVVTLTVDRFVNKGPGRPYFTSKVRAKMLAALEVVDYVAISTFPTAEHAIKSLRPHFYVKGPDYKNRESDATGGILREEAAVERAGGKLVFTDDEVFSSSALINRFFTQWTEQQQVALDEVKQAGGMSAIEAVLSRVAQEKICVVGEPIVDTYVFCTPEGISSKYPSVSAKFNYEENYAGGSLAIANHMADFVKEVTLCATHGNEGYFQALVDEKLDKRISLRCQAIENIPTPRKTRFIASDKSQRIFEITDLRSDQWQHHSGEAFCKTLQEINSKTHTTILADFGHGLFEGEVLEAVSRLKGFVGLNVQTNSSNFGFNPFTKHKRFSFLSLDTKEVRVAYHDRLTAPLDLARRLRDDAVEQGASAAMTLGASGAYYFPSGAQDEWFCPTFTEGVVDATGAGDAFFAIASLLVKVGCPPVLIPFLGNVFAGLQTKIIGNKSSVTKNQFMRAIATILK